MPIAVMFVIRNKYFSAAFLFLHVADSLSLAHAIWLIKTEIKPPIDPKGFGLVEAIFLVISVACLLLYVIAVTIRYLARSWKG